MSNAPQPTTLSKTERRKAQNRRAQANLRRKRQEEIENLQQQIGWLKAQNTIKTPMQDGENQHMNEDQGRLLNNCRENIPRSVIEDNLTVIQALDQDYLNAQDIIFPEFFENPLPLPGVTIGYTPLSLDDSMTLTTQYVSGTPNESTIQPQAPPRQALQLCAFDALTSNATLLNVSSECFLSTHSDSPFYTPFRTTAASHSNLPCSLRPTAAQRAYPHQPWIDCIPLAEFRSRIILAASRRPPLLDTLDMWHDVLSDGLYCHGDPVNSSAWKMSNSFAQRWHNVLTIDFDSLEAMCLASNPPLSAMSLLGD